MNQLVREAVLYSAASGCALAVDVGLLWLLVEVAHMHYLVAASVAFLTGTAVVYAFSVRGIFRHRRVRDRRLEFSTFAAIGVLGLFVNLLVLSFLILLFVQTIGLLQKFGTTPSPAMNIPMVFFFGCGMVFATIGAIEYVRQIVCLLLVLCGRMTEIVVRGPDGKDLKTSVKI